MAYKKIGFPCKPLNECIIGEIHSKQVAKFVFGGELKSSKSREFEIEKMGKLTLFLKEYHMLTFKSLD